MFPPKNREKLGIHPRQIRNNEERKKKRKEVERKIRRSWRERKEKEMEKNLPLGRREKYQVPLDVRDEHVAGEK